MSGKEQLQEIPRTQRYVTRPSLLAIFTHKDKDSKGDAMYTAYMQYGYTLQEIGEYSDVHYTTVSKAIRKINEQYKK